MSAYVISKAHGPLPSAFGFRGRDNLQGCLDLPFGTILQTQNALGMDMELENLKKIYAEIGIVNQAMASRLRTLSVEDSAINAVVLLDIFAKMMPYSIEDSLEEIRYLFLQP